MKLLKLPVFILSCLILKSDFIRIEIGEYEVGATALSLKSDFIRIEIMLLTDILLLKKELKSDFIRIEI